MTSTKKKYLYFCTQGITLRGLRFPSHPLSYRLSPAVAVCLYVCLCNSAVGKWYIWKFATPKFPTHRNESCWRKLDLLSSIATNRRRISDRIFDSKIYIWKSLHPLRFIIPIHFFSFEMHLLHILAWRGGECGVVFRFLFTMWHPSLNRLVDICCMWDTRPKRANEQKTGCIIFMRAQQKYHNNDIDDVEEKTPTKINR